MVIPSWLGRFDTQPDKVDALGKVGQRRDAPARIAQELSPGVKALVGRLDLTRVLPSQLIQVAQGLCREGFMSLDVYYQFRDATRDMDGKPRAEVPLDLLREVREGTRQAQAISRKSGDYRAEKYPAEFRLSAHGLAYLAASIKGLRLVDVRV